LLQANKYGIIFLGNFLFDISVVKNETEWLLKHLIYSKFDKATNNACLICTWHIHLQALKRLSGEDFLFCRTSSIWDLSNTILDKVSHNSSQMLPECFLPFQFVPYLMAIYIKYKAKYKWETNAHNIVFSNIAVLLTITSKVILESVKTWAQFKVINYKNFLQVITRVYWIINSIIDVTLNLPMPMHDIYVANLYETTMKLSLWID
jgi:hypothetical protein